jgi:hypothetical protein
MATDGEKNLRKRIQMRKTRESEKINLKHSSNQSKVSRSNMSSVLKKSKL